LDVTSIKIGLFNFQNIAFTSSVTDEPTVQCPRLYQSGLANEIDG